MCTTLSVGNATVEKKIQPTCQYMQMKYSITVYVLDCMQFDYDDDNSEDDDDDDCHLFFTSL